MENNYFDKQLNSTQFFNNPIVTVTSNCVLVDNTAMQVSNISRIWTLILEKPKVRGKYIVAIVVSSLFLLWCLPGVFSLFAPFSLLGIMISSIILIVYILLLLKDNKIKDTYALNIQMNSRSIYSISSDYQSLLVEAFNAITKSMENKLGKEVIVNMQNNTYTNCGNNDFGSGNSFGGGNNFSNNINSPNSNSINSNGNNNNISQSSKSTIMPDGISFSELENELRILINTIETQYRQYYADLNVTPILHEAYKSAQDCDSHGVKSAIKKIGAAINGIATGLNLVNIIHLIYSLQL